MKAKVVVSLCCLVAAMMPLAGYGGEGRLSEGEQAAADAGLGEAARSGNVRGAIEWLDKGERQRGEWGRPDAVAGGGGDGARGHRGVAPQTRREVS